MVEVVDVVVLDVVDVDVLVVDDELLVVDSATDDEVDEEALVPSALLVSSLHALKVRPRTPTVRTARARRVVMCPVCQHEPAKNVQVSG
jgi:hypothetical protein